MTNFTRTLSNKQSLNSSSPLSRPSVYVFATGYGPSALTRILFFFFSRLFVSFFCFGRELDLLLRLCFLFLVLISFTVSILSWSYLFCFLEFSYFLFISIFLFRNFLLVFRSFGNYGRVVRVNNENREVI